MVLSHTEEQTILKFFLENQPNCVVNVAGPTNIQESLLIPDPYTVGQLDQVKKQVSILQRLSTKPKYVYLSSGSVYGSTSELGFGESEPTNPLSPYAQGKLLAENFLQSAQDQFKFASELYILRGFSLFSVESPHRLFRLICQIMLGFEQPTLYGDGNELRDFVSVEFFSKVIERIAVNPNRPPSGLYNLSSGQGLSISQICKVASAESATKRKITFNGIIRSGDPRNMVGLNDKLVTNFGLKPHSPLLEITELFARSFQ
jgi:nucleoside-diphosphate-sugar epimerase